MNVLNLPKKEKRFDVNMDLLGYKEHWNEKKGNIPEKRINVASHTWNMNRGEIFFRDLPYKNVICKKIKDVSEVSNSILETDFVVPPVGDVTGHMMVKDNTLSFVNDVNNTIPVMPNYVRDLAGRTVCIAECFPVQRDPSVTGRFPVNSFLIDQNFEGSDLIENVFFSHFRTLDPTIEPFGSPNQEPIFYNYSDANLYPYKLRVDSFYQDGWRLPQTEMLYTNPSLGKEDLEQAVADLSSKWELTTDQGDYESFYEGAGGEDYFDSLFHRGVTLIPTLEAYNTNNIVDRDFNLVDFIGGKVVPELHEIVSYVDNKEPQGTIVKVIEPGYMTEYNLKKAKVVVSNGKDYVSPNNEDPDPLYPDLRLPHPRTSAKWGSVHIPTHPKHFETPAIWGWDSKTGLFMQEKGPIWDPLHYYYESVDKVIYYYQDKVMEDNYWFYSVPEEMKLKFYPVVPFSGFDIFDAAEKKDRVDYMCRPYTICKRHKEDIFSAGMCYHVMPVEFEYEIDSWLMPELAPVNRAVQEVPLNIRDRLIKVIQSNIAVDYYLKIQNENSQNNTDVVNNEKRLKNSQGNAKKDYPSLLRYYDSITSINRVGELMTLFFIKSDELDYVETRMDYMSQINLPDNIDDFILDLTLANYEFKDRSFVMLQNRHNLYYKYYNEYLMSSWNCRKAGEMLYLVEKEDVKLKDNSFSHVAIMQPPTF
ncbi:MAG: nucleotide exchange factor GrpE [Proteobacteria bacterium]|nr:nucleotide exchange factor GrpE [Pseudomonadota bacterium]